MRLKNISVAVKLLLGFLLSFAQLSNAQTPSFNANTVVAPYNGDFAYGTNPGYYGGFNNNKTSDKLMGDLFAKGSFHTTRPALYDYFLEQYGINIRKPEFKYYTEELGMKEMTLFVSGPSEDHRDTTTIVCNGVKKRSKMFKNLYLPIWVKDASGNTVINEKNYYAAYIHKVVTHYGKFVKFYEVWNEPDFTHSANPYKAAGLPGSWYDSPSPCELENMYASIQSYVRTLRITYEVVKAIDPTAYITTGGIGYESFLDAMLRSTDNPDGGKVTAEYPLKSGAYFDVLSYHYYPQYNLNKWDNKLGGFVYSRHSDKAAQIVFDFKDKLEKVLMNNGYDGTNYPKKHFILTEVNIPRKTYATKDFIGSEDAQRNFIIKTFIGCQKNGVRQMYTYCLGDKATDATSQASTDGMDLMGMYYDLNSATPETATLTPAGVGAKSVSEFLYTYRFDAGKTAAMNLPANIDGGAFTKGNETRFVLWAKTATDLSEAAAATYTFPSSFGVKTITTRNALFGIKPTTVNIPGSTVALTGEPAFITVNGSGIIAPLALSISAGDDKIITLPTNPVTFEGTVKSGAATSYLWTKKDGPAATLTNSTTSKLTVSGLTAGTYIFELTAKDQTGATAKDEVQLTVLSTSVVQGPEKPQTGAFKITYPQVTNMNKHMDKGSNKFYKSTIRVQVESTNPDAIASVYFSLGNENRTDDYADRSGNVPTTYSYHNTYYALEPGTYTVDILVTDKKGVKTATKSTFTVVDAQAREEESAPAHTTVLSESGPYSIFDIQGVLLASGNGRFDTQYTTLAAGVYVFRNAEKSVKFVIEK